MKFQKFKEKDYKKTGIIIFTICCVLLVTIVFLYKSFAIFETNENKNIIKGNVEDRGDLRFYVYVDNKLAKDAPNKDSGYSLNTGTSYCENGSMVSWNEDTWSVEIKNMSTERTKCYLYFEKLYRETELNGAIPDLGNGRLTPVTIEENGVVKKADLTKNWYQYSEQRWANAVILKENSYDLLNASGKVIGGTKEGEYVHLDGENDYIDLGLANYDFGNQITVAIHFKYNSHYETRDSVLIGNPEANGVTLYVENATKTIAYQTYDENRKNYNLLSNMPIEEGKEYVVIATYDGNSMQLYMNNVKDNNTISRTGNILVSSMPVLVGANPNPSGNHSAFANIDVKEVAIFKRALSETEIQTVSNEDFKITNGEGLLKYINFTNKKYQDDEVIPEDNIESYFVWIPRYEYQLWNGEEETLKFTGVVANLNTVNDTTTQPEINNQQKINIKFVTKNMEIKNGNTKNSWLTHPAFTSFDSNGFWAGKFETGYEGAKSLGEANQNKIASESLIIKPNVYSWRNIQVGNAFYTSYGYKRELDSHMMKNMEWGAVAYLANSEYGLCKGGTCTNIILNNNSNFITGYSSSKEATCGYTGTDLDCHKYEGTILGANGTYTYNYNDARSQKASTTGNYYGVYDMSGGAWEYMMGVILNSNNIPLIGRNKSYNSGFIGEFGCPTCDQNSASDTNLTDGLPWPDSKYYDTYSYDTGDQQFQRGKLGDATKEVGPFYQITSAGTSRRVSSYYADHAYFITSSNPWFARGGHWYNGSESGLTAFSSGHGQVSNTSFRVVLSP